MLQAIVEEVKSKSSVTSKNVTIPGASKPGQSVRDLLAHEATKTLESKRNIQIAATKEKSLSEIKQELGMPLDTVTETETAGVTPAPATTTRRRVRQKMRSTPVSGGSLFDDPPDATDGPNADKKGEKSGAFQPFSAIGMGGQSAELVVNGEVFKIRVMPDTIHRIRSGYSGELLDDSSVKFSQEDVPIEHRLQGFIRTSGLQTISEDLSDTASNVGSDVDQTGVL